MKRKNIYKQIKSIYNSYIDDLNNVLNKNIDGIVNYTIKSIYNSYIDNLNYVLNNNINGIVNYIINANVYLVK